MSSNVARDCFFTFEKDGREDYMEIKEGYFNRWELVGVEVVHLLRHT